MMMSNVFSVTELIDKYKQPFDRDFWSAYKALEQLLSKEQWNIEKKSLLNTKRFDASILDVYSISKNDFNATQQSILDAWEAKRVEGQTRGTFLHDSLYKQISNNKYDFSKLVEVHNPLTIQQSLDEAYGIYPEFPIQYSFMDIVIKGRPDLIIKNENELSIVDWKTDEKIEQKSGFNTAIKSNAKMLFPLNDIMDCNYFHYTMQLSLYAYILEQLYPKLHVSNLMIVHFDPKGIQSLYRLDYMKEAVVRLLKYANKMYIHEVQKEKRKHIDYGDR
jgi:ATP-dependent exoDNAse (exonuclease V) beta subunit